VGGGENRPLCRNRLLTGYNAAEPDLAAETVFWLSLRGLLLVEDLQCALPERNAKGEGLKAAELLDREAHRTSAPVRDDKKARRVLWYPTQAKTA